MIKDKTFDANPQLEQYFETADGTKFYKEHDAKAYARTLQDKDVKKVKRQFEVLKATEPPLKLTADQRIDAIEKMESIEEVQEALKGETAKTVKAAGEARIKAIEASNPAIKEQEKQND